MATVGTMLVTETLTKISCGECGGVYAIAERYREECWQQGGSWRCPYCNCQWGFFSNNENKQLSERNIATAERIRHDQTKMSLRATKAVATRRKKQIDRVDKGVCPYCDRTFQNLQRHMQSKHGK